MSQPSQSLNCQRFVVIVSIVSVVSVVSMVSVVGEVGFVTGAATAAYVALVPWGLWTSWDLRGARKTHGFHCFTIARKVFEAQILATPVSRAAFATAAATETPTRGSNAFGMI